MKNRKSSVKPAALPPANNAARSPGAPRPPKKPTVPTLTSPLAELILVHAIRSIDAINPDKDAVLVHRLLTVLPLDPSVTATNVTRAALTQLWWITTDSASRNGNLRLLDLLFAQCSWRPLTYTERGLRDALVQCHVDVLEWWYTKRDQRLMWFADVMIGDVAQVLMGLSDSTDREKESISKHGGKLFLWYCKQHAQELAANVKELADDGFASVTFGCFIQAACKFHHYDMLEYLERHVPCIASALTPMTLHQSLLDAARAMDFRSLYWLRRKCAHGSTPSNSLPFAARRPTAAAAAPPQAHRSPLTTTCPLLHNTTNLRSLTLGVFASGSTTMVNWLQAELAQAGLPPASIDPGAAMTGASLGGHLDLIQWAIDEQLLIALDPRTGQARKRFAIDLETILEHARPLTNQHVAVLAWWTANTTRLGVLVDARAQIQHILAAVRGPASAAFVRWWLTQPMHLTHDRFDQEDFQQFIVAAAQGGCIDTLDVLADDEWFSIHFATNTEAIRAMSEFGHLDALKWWDKRARAEGGMWSATLDAYQSKATLAVAGSGGHVHVVAWWMDKLKAYVANSKAKKKKKMSAMYSADHVLHDVCVDGRIDVLEWWREHMPEVVAGNEVLWFDASPSVVHWWVAHGTGISASDPAWVLQAANYGHAVLLDWHMRRGALKLDKEILTALVCVAGEHGDVGVLEYLAVSAKGRAGRLLQFGADLFDAIFAVFMDPPWHAVDWWAAKRKSGDPRFKVDVLALSRQFTRPNVREHWKRLHLIVLEAEKCPVLPLQAFVAEASVQDAASESDSDGEEEEEEDWEDFSDDETD